MGLLVNLVITYPEFWVRSVIPAKAGIQVEYPDATAESSWIPACAGMTKWCLSLDVTNLPWWGSRSDFRKWVVCSLVIRWLTLVLVALLTHVNARAHADMSDAGDRLRLYLQQTLTATSDPTPVPQPMRGLLMTRTVRSFYARRVYRPAWSQDNIFIPHVDVLVAMLQEAEREGLHPMDYHLNHIVNRLTTIRSASS